MAATADSEAIRVALDVLQALRYAGQIHPDSQLGKEIEHVQLALKGKLDIDSALEGLRVMLKESDKEQGQGISGIIQLTIDALNTDGEHHKQWYLERILDISVRAAVQDAGKGISP